MYIIGEKINSSTRAIASAIAEQNKHFIQQIAINQIEAGAHSIDLNAGIFGEREAPLLAWLVECVQEATDAPLCIDSPNPIALEQALAVTHQQPIVNSITLENIRYKELIPFITYYKASVIALCLDDTGISAKAERRFEIACRLVDKLSNDGVDLRDIYLDVMAQPIGSDSASGRVLLDTVRAVKEGIPGVHICCGLSNISFGLPHRRLLNQALAVALVTCGIDTLIADPLDQKLMSLLGAAKVIAGSDKYCCQYIKQYRDGRLLKT